MQPHNLISLHSTAQAFIVYAGAFSVGATIAAAAVYLDVASKGRR